MASACQEKKGSAIDSATLQEVQIARTHFMFILETNGILIDSDPSYARELSRFDNVHVRVSLKATTPGGVCTFNRCGSFCFQSSVEGFGESAGSRCFIERGCYDFVYNRRELTRADAYAERNSSNLCQKP